jgi:hypothetical protein
LNTICHSYVKNWDLLTRDLPWLTMARKYLGIWHAITF